MSTTEIPIKATRLEFIPVEWGELGRVFAAADSTTQAEFLLAFWEEVSDAQILYIGDDSTFGPAGQSTRLEVAEVFHELAKTIAEGGKQ